MLGNLAMRIEVVTDDSFETAQKLLKQLARIERINALRVDRSFLDRMPLQAWSPEAEAAEPKFKSIRENTTVYERIQAWRKLFKLKKPITKR
jgi:hypothetical protein